MLWWLKLIQTLRLFIFTIPSSSLDFPAQHVPHTHYRALCKQRLICQQNVSGSYLRGSVTGSWNTRAAGDAAWFGGCPRSLENHYNFSISTLFRGMRSVGEKEAGGSKEVSASCWISCLGFWVHESLHRCMEMCLVHECERGVEGLGSWQGIPLSAASVLPGSHYSQLKRPPS